MFLRSRHRRLIGWILTLLLTVSSVSSAAMMGAQVYPPSGDSTAQAGQDPGMDKAPCPMHQASASHPAAADRSGNDRHPDAAMQHDASGHCSTCVICSATLFDVSGVGTTQGGASPVRPVAASLILPTPFDTLFKPPKP